MDKRLKDILDEMEIKSIKYRGITWKIGDTFCHYSTSYKKNKKGVYDPKLKLVNKSKILTDRILSIDIVHLDTKSLKTELRLNGEVYASDIRDCFKLKKYDKY